MNESPTIAKLTGAEPESLNYGLLRKHGVDYIEALGSDFWTDFNIHDPGITLLEALCYALTDLSYRARFGTADLLSGPSGLPSQPDRQGFFTARNILTVNPWTPTDFRKLLVDVVGIKNAWVMCKCCCPCDMYLYAECAKSRLTYSKTEHPIVVKGFYDVLLEFDEESAGDLNSGKVKQTFVYSTGPNTTATAEIEIRLPSWHAIQGQKAKFANFRHAKKINQVTVQFISGNKTDNVDVPATELATALRGPLYATLDIGFDTASGSPLVDTLSLADVPVTVWFDSREDRQAMKLADLKAAIADALPGGIAARYLAVLQRADEVVKEATSQLQTHRNLCEDYCTIDAVEVADVGICLDLELRPDAEIERVLAEAYYEISQYFAPAIKFYSLQERRDAGIPVDEIFNGPALANGFIDDDQLAATQLKTTLYASDVINILSDIDGVIAVKNFVFTRYTDDGVRDAVFPWSIDIPDRHQPRLYLEGSKILVVKNGLPVLPDKQELADTLQMIKGENEPAPLAAKDIDLPVPDGVPRDVAAYYPVQYSLPRTYGVSRDGLPPTVTAGRAAQAKQLKAYLIFFEQVLVNYLYQLKNLTELFAIDDTVKHTYFTALIGPDIIRDVDQILYQGTPALTPAVLDSLAETNVQWLDRRNRFLDHMLARFAEQFADYALMLYDFETKKSVAASELIKDKVAFLKEYPFISKNRARSFDYKDPALVCSNDNIAGLKRRIQLLLALDPKEKIFVVEHLLLRPRNRPGGAIPDGDPLLPVCLSPDCSLCGEEDPYSFRLTIVLNGETGLVNKDIPFRRFAEQTIRLETPAHLALKICWVTAKQLADFEQVYCAWLAELAKLDPEPDPVTLHNLLVEVLKVFANLKSVYPPATLHDCVEGSEENAVFLGQTVITG
jgi:hypothetical protein